MKKVVLAYSGGLDTSFCIKYLKEEKGMDVHAILVNTGGFNPEEIDAVRTRALDLGADKFEAIDTTDEYYQNCVKYLIYGNVLRNNTYPLSVSAERMYQALKIVEYANNIKADAIAHGSTGAGNDQIRFDLVFLTMAPSMEIITPIRDLALSRNQEIDFLQKRGVNQSWEKSKYSINQGLWGTSVGGVETLGSRDSLPNEAYPSQLQRQDPKVVKLSFHQGELTAVDGAVDTPVHNIQKVNELANAYAIGRDTHVGDTIIGIKGRVGFEAGGPLIIIKAHHLLEKHTQTKWQQYWKEQLGNWYGMMLHEGQFLDPVMRNIEAFLTDTQSKVNGDVFVQLHPYRFVLEGIDSPHDLMKSKIATYGEENKGWTSEEAKGFIKILGNQHKIYHSVNGSN